MTSLKNTNFAARAANVAAAANFGVFAVVNGDGGTTVITPDGGTKV